MISLPYIMPDLYGKEVELFIVVPQQEENMDTKKVKYDFQKFILSGPIMSDNQYQEFKQRREEFNLWRTL